MPAQRAIASGNLNQQRFDAARPGLKVAYGIRSDHLALVDDDDLLAGLLHLGQNVRAENDGVVAGETFDQIACFVDLLGIESCGRLVEDQHIGIVNDRLRQPDALAIAFRELAQKLRFTSAMKQRSQT